MISSSSRDRVLVALPTGHPEVAAAALVWAGCAAGLAQGPHPGPVGAAAVVVAAGGAVVLVATGRRVLGMALLGLVVAGVVSGMLAAARIEAAAGVAIVPGRHQVLARAASDPTTEPHGAVLLAVVSGPTTGPGVTLLVSFDPFAEGAVADSIAAGDLLEIGGVVADRPGRLGGDAYRGTLDADSVEVVAAAGGPFFGPGNLLRRLVLDRLDDGSDASALLAGFLVGDTDRLPEHRLEQLRQAGLTHFVAVSGSNVALFLGAWWVVVGPFQLEPRLRCLLGIAMLGVFVVATRWEPSVVRAATMAAVVLAGRIVGVPVAPWRALGLAVTGLLLFSPDLAVDVGFQLSVAATAGVLVAMPLTPRRRPRWLWSILSVTVGAQLAVMPIVLARFGAMPVLSPLANVLALPLVTTATVLGGVGALTGITPVLALGLTAGRGVLDVASMASGWPQVGAVGAGTALGVAAGVAGAGRSRPVVVALVVAVLVAWGLPVPPPAVPAVVFLDVGQGDAILVRRPPEVVVLVDGGPDPLVLEAALRRHGVDAIDLVVVTHGDADHAGGLQGVFERHSVGALWYPEGQHTGGLVDGLLADASAHGVPARGVGTGHVATFSPLRLEVLGPGRRFAADNDGSVVMLVSAGGIEVLLTGDVEAIGEAELPAVRPDVLQVPHHGSATTDLRWLEETVGATAVISVGENGYGHPRAEVLDTLRRVGAAVWSTLEHGDVVVPLCPCPP